MICPCGNAAPDLTSHLGFCSAECLDTEVFWYLIRDDLAELLEETR